jgi:hypothetical protein
MKQNFICKTCNKEFKADVYPSSKGKSTFQYCSRKCAADQRIRKLIPCEYCGDKFHPSKDASYCSRECFSLSTRGRKAKNAHPEKVKEYIKSNYEKSDVKEISVFLNITIGAVRNIAYKLGLKIRPDIKRQHVKKAVSVHMIGENNPNWQGGGTILEWGNNWNEQRNKARLRDDYTCQVCGFQSKSISVHHIKPRRLFLGRMSDANVLSNLISLCRSHHLLVEIGKIPCPKPKV